MGHYVAKSDGDGDRLETFRNSNNKSWAVLQIAFQMNFTTQLKNRNLIQRNEPPSHKMEQPLNEDKRSP